MKKIGVDIIELRQQGKSYNEIANILNCTKSLINYYCTKAGLSDIGLGNLHITPENINEWQEYCNTHSIRETSKKFGISQSTLVRYGVIGRRRLSTVYEKIDTNKSYINRSIDDPNHKGELAQFAVIFDLMKQGYNGICMPISWTSPYDLVVQINSTFQRIQIKHVKSIDGRLTVRVMRHIDARRNGGKNKVYENTEFDILAIYCPDTNECYYVRRELFGNGITLLLRDAKNGNTDSRYAKNYKMISLS